MIDRGDFLADRLNSYHFTMFWRILDSWNNAVLWTTS